MVLVMILNLHFQSRIIIFQIQTKLNSVNLDLNAINYKLVLVLFYIINKLKHPVLILHNSINLVKPFVNLAKIVTIGKKEFVLILIRQYMLEMVILKLVKIKKFVISEIHVKIMPKAHVNFYM